MPKLALGVIAPAIGVPVPMITERVDASPEAAGEEAANGVLMEASPVGEAQPWKAIAPGGKQTGAGLILSDGAVLMMPGHETLFARGDDISVMEGVAPAPAPSCEPLLLQSKPKSAIVTIPPAFPGDGPESIGRCICAAGCCICVNSASKDLGRNSRGRVFFC